MVFGIFPAKGFHPQKRPLIRSLFPPTSPPATWFDNKGTFPGTDASPPPSPPLDCTYCDWSFREVNKHPSARAFPLLPPAHPLQTRLFFFPISPLLTGSVCVFSGFCLKNIRNPILFAIFPLFFIRTSLHRGAPYLVDCTADSFYWRRSHRSPFVRPPPNGAAFPFHASSKEPKQDVSSKIGFSQSTASKFIRSHPLTRA